MSRAVAAPTCLAFVVVLSIVLTSCGKSVKAPPPPALDRATFIDETSIKLPASVEILESKSEVDDVGTHFSVVLKLPKSAENVLGPGIEEDPKFRSSISAKNRQLDMNHLARVGVTLKDPNIPYKSYDLKSKSKGSGNATAYPDGETIYVLCHLLIRK